MMILYYNPVISAMPTLEKMLNVRLADATHARLASLTKVTGRSKSFLTVEALEAYIEQQAWQIAEVKAGLAEADCGEFATDAEVAAVLAKYAT